MKNLLSGIKSRALIIVSGILLGFTVVFSELGLLAYLAIVPLALVFFRRIESEEYNLKKAYFDGFVFYMSFDIVVFHWFTYFYPLDYAMIGDAEAILIIALAWFGVSAIQSVFSALVFVIASRLARTNICKRYSILTAPLTAALFAVNEWTQTFTWAGIPWGRIAISQTEMPILIQSASLFGSYFITFLVILVGFLIAYAILYANKRRIATLFAVSIFVFNLILGTVMYFIPTATDERSVKVASIQGNLQSQKIFESNSDKFAVHERLTRDAAADGAELILWPEGTFAVDIHTKIKVNGGVSKTISEAASDLAEELGVTIAIGSYVRSSGTINSSMSVFYPDGSSNINAYAKRRPVPFGEFLPFREFVSVVAPMLAKINVFTDVDAGEKATVFDATLGEDPIQVGTLICFDSIYETLGIDSARAGAEMLIIPSNDSWFYDSRALYMHHSQNILRAVEQGKYTVSCASTGISSVVSDKGEIIKDIPIYQEGYVIDTVYASSTRTLYSYIGNLFVYICIAFVGVIFFVDILKKRK